MKTLPNVLQPSFEEVFKGNYHLQGNWSKAFFKNNFPIVLELGCGKGEYTCNLAQKFPGRNFVGVDIKGSRMWKGAKFALNNMMSNVAFLRTRIEFIDACFGKGEVDEIWLTFPDPQLKERRKKKRLTSARFLNLYKNILAEDGIIHLKTDSTELYEYTLFIIKHNYLPLIKATEDLYGDGAADKILGIKTFYEKMFLEEGKMIKYLKFKLTNKENHEPET